MNALNTRIGEDERVRRLGMLLLLVALSCGNTPSAGTDGSAIGGAGGSVAGGAGGSVSGGSGGSAAGGAAGSAPVACDAAKDGDPCGPGFQTCGPQDGYGCVKFCFANSGVWRVSCSYPPTCDTSVIAQGARCDLSTPLTCGPFQIDSRCGAVSATARCTGIGWAYNLPCDPDCESLGETDCKKYKGCGWAVPCANPNFPSVAPRCVDFPPGLGLCDSTTCPTGTTCRGVALNPGDISSGDCSGAGTAAAFCDP